MISLLGSSDYVGQTFPQALGIPWCDVSSSCVMKTNDGLGVEIDPNKPETRELARTSYVDACLNTWLKKPPFSAYNVTNRSFVSTEDVLEMIKDILKPVREFVFWENEASSHKTGAVALQYNCIMDSSKSLSAGIQMRRDQDALENALST